MKKVLDEKHQQLQKDLQQLQVVETYLFDELKKANGDKNAPESKKRNCRNNQES